ncbi:hypothetical protein BK004_01295 [bacterium CG10_46_32]|nr:MAG: hypothetical protein BK004_01295 [bacterium CG10_46_32]PIR56334.1 MAG: hypothetical protein COU73_01310 [Parcubacteria group bacterium CG10_big_fil_rev_8_21_14_0_10_46_32]
MIHEFIGLPGAGKSYMANQIAQSKGIVGVEIKNTKERLARSLLFFISHPFFSARLLAIFIQENYKNSKLLKHKFATIVLEIMAREQKVKQGEMIETGFFQLLLSIYEREISEKDVASLFYWLKKRDYMVYIVEASREIREKRIQERGRIPRGGVVTDTSKLVAWFGLLEHNFETVKQGIIKDFLYERIQNN